MITLWFDRKLGACLPHELPDRFHDISGACYGSCGLRGTARRMGKREGEWW